MSFAEILEELPSLTSEERKEIIDRALALDNRWLDSEAALSDSEKALLEERFRDLEAHPAASIPWDDAKASLLSRIKR